FFLPVFSFGVPAALVVYFLVSNIWRIGQQAVITRTLYSGQQPASPIEAVVVEDAPQAALSSSTKSGRTSAKSGANKGGGGKGGAKQAAAQEPADDGRAAKSPMGRNRRADSSAGAPRRSRPAPKPKPKQKPERAPTSSGRVTPP